MHTPTVPTAPLTVIHATAARSPRVSTVPLCALASAVIDSVWSRAALARQHMARGVMALTQGWETPHIIARSALLVVSMFWGPALLRTALPEATLAVFLEPGPDPGGRGSAQSLQETARRPVRGRRAVS